MSSSLFVPFARCISRLGNHLAFSDGGSRGEHNNIYIYISCTEAHISRTLKHTQKQLNTLSSKAPHINRTVTGEAQYPSLTAPHENHTRVSRTCRHAPPSHIHGHYLLIETRGPHLIITTASRGGSLKHCREANTKITSTKNTKPHNNGKYPQIGIEQPHTTSKQSSSDYILV